MCRVEQRHCTFSFFSFLRRSSSLELELELLSLSLELSLGIGSRASRAWRFGVASASAVLGTQNENIQAGGSVV